MYKSIACRKWIVMLFVVCFSFIQHVNSSKGRYIVKTIAGGGVCDGGPSSLAVVRNPTSCFVSAANEVYISDTENNRIRKLLANGNIITFAGNGIGGYNGDGMLATDAQLKGVQGIDIGLSGEMYIADTGNHRIRKINTNGIMETIAGDGSAGYNGDNILAVNAQLNNPGSVLVSTTGEIYIADSTNNRIRKILTNGTMITIAGTIVSIAGSGTLIGDGGLATSAKLKNPQGIAIVNNEIFIADAGNNRIRKIAANGTITTIAGTGLTSFNGDGLAAVSSNLNSPYRLAVSPNGEMFITDTNNNRIRKILTNGTMITIAGIAGSGGYNGDNSLADSSKLSSPKGVALDSSGNIYIADASNNRVRKISTNGTITTVAGNGYSVFCGENVNATNVAIGVVFSVASDNNDNIYFADSTRIRKISASGLVSTIAGTGVSGYSGDGGLAVNAMLNYPQIALDLSGNIYLSDRYNHRVRKILTNGTIITIAGTGSSGISGDNILATNAMLSNPQGVAVSLNGDVFFADLVNNRICKISTNGTLTSIAGGNKVGEYDGDGVSALTAKLYSPSAVSLGSNGELYIADTGNQVIRKISNGIIETVAGVANEGSYNGDYILAKNATLTTPTGVAIGLNGEVFIADKNNHRVRKVLTNGTIITIAGTGSSGISGENTLATSAMLNGPQAVSLLPNGDVFFSESGNSRLMVITELSCFNILSSDTSVCGGNGECIYIDTCECSVGWFGYNCSIPSCFGVISNNTGFVCSGNGNCTNLDTCICNFGWNGSNCENHVDNSNFINSTNITQIDNSTQFNTTETTTNKTNNTQIDNSLISNSTNNTQIDNSTIILNNSTSNNTHFGNNTLIDNNTQIDSGTISNSTNNTLPNNATQKNSTNTTNGTQDYNNTQIDSGQITNSTNNTQIDNSTIILNNSTSNNTQFGNNTLIDNNTQIDIEPINNLTNTLNSTNTTQIDNSTLFENITETTESINSTNVNKQEELVTCYGIEKNDSTVCTGHGICISQDFCQCSSNSLNGYWGDEKCSSCQESYCDPTSCTKECASNHSTNNYYALISLLIIVVCAFICIIGVSFIVAVKLRAKRKNKRKQTNESELQIKGNFA